MKIVVRVIGYTVLVYVAVVIGLFLSQRDMMYYPGHIKPALPAGVIGLEEIRVTTKDGLSLFGWYKPPMSDDKPVIVWFHGNASNVEQAASATLPYMRQGYGVLLVEYRGYATNPGKPSEQGLYDDGRAFLSWLTANGIDQSRIVLYGQSIGSGPALQMALEMPDVRALVLEAPFTSALDIARASYPFLPVDMMMKDRYDNMSRIKKLETLLIVVHGERDAVVPLAMGQALFDAAPVLKSMVVLPASGHNDINHADVAAKVMSLLSE